MRVKEAAEAAGRNLAMYIMSSGGSLERIEDSRASAFGCSHSLVEDIKDFSDPIMRVSIPETVEDV